MRTSAFQEVGREYPFGCLGKFPFFAKHTLFAYVLAVSQLQFTSRHQGQTVTRLVGSSVNFTWSFSGDVLSVFWGLKRAGVNYIADNGKLVSIDKLGNSDSKSAPASYTGRVSGWRSGDRFSGQAIFTLTSITRNDERFYGCQIMPVDPVDVPKFDFVKLVVVGRLQNFTAKEAIHKRSKRI